MCDPFRYFDSPPKVIWLSRLGPIFASRYQEGAVSPFRTGGETPQATDVENSVSLGIGPHVSGIADPFNGYIDEFRIAHVQRSDGWVQTTWNNMSDPGAFAAAGAEEQQAANRRRWQAPVWGSA